MKFLFWFKKLVRFSLRRWSQIQYLFLKLVYKAFSPRIALTYDAISKQDGLGAQLQRILAIYSLSVDLRVSYIHTGLVDVAVHPLDSFKKKNEVNFFLKKVNRIFFIETMEAHSFVNARTYLIHSLSNLTLLAFLAKSLHSKNPIVLKITEPYKCSDLFPSMYEGVGSNLPFLNLDPIDKSTIGIHYRRGFGNFDIQKGEGSSRELEIATIVQKCNQIISDNNDISSVCIFTDAVTSDSIFSPPVHQRSLWLTNENFNGENLVSKGIDVHSSFSSLNVPFTVVSGGDPLDSLISMAHFDVLILSRSSFGYVSALLTTRKQVWLPEDFWHPPLRSWFTY